MVLFTLLTALLSITLVDAAFPNNMLRGKPGIPKISAPDHLVTSLNGTALPSLETVFFFDQIIDHNFPFLGTFSQRYWVNWEFYQPGGPIILMTPGEVNADGYLGYLTNATINGQIAQRQNGATVLIEHRCFGFSNPYNDLTEETLLLLTIQQAIDDLVYFAQNVNLPIPGGDNVKPNTTPWILVGGSYSGALVSWTMVNQPGVFYAGYASSGVVEATTDFWAYFGPIFEYMPQNCSSDVQAVISYLDQIYAAHDTFAIQILQDIFGLGSLSHVEDFAAALRQNLFDWQALQPFTGPNSWFYQFCDALEVLDGVSAPASGWGLDVAIVSWGAFWQNTYYNHLCGNSDPETCLGTYNPNEFYYSNVTIDNPWRSWFWLVCNQLGFYQVGPPFDQPAIVSRILQPIYEERQCTNYFPDVFPFPPTPSTDLTNFFYAGWDVQANNLFFANGLRDPWRDVTVSAEGLNKASTFFQPIYISDGFHTSDLITENGLLDDTILSVQNTGLEYINEWLLQF